MTFDDFTIQYQKLRLALPRSPSYNLDNENSEYTGYTYHSSNCYYCFDCAYCKNCLYNFDGARCVSCVDCDYCVDCEMLYECVDCYHVYNGFYLDYCARLYDSYFCWDCMDGHDLFGCTHLKQKQYCIFNKQYTKEDYEKKTKELLRLPASDNLARLKELIKTYPFGPTNVTHSENSDYGNHVHYSSNMYLCFDAARSQNCGYLYDSFYCKNSYDLTQCAHVELCYECRDSARLYNCDFVDWSSNCYDSSFLTDCKDCHNCFGCVGVVHRKFCILNRQYSEEEYKKIITEIKESRRKHGSVNEPIHLQ